MKTIVLIRRRINELNDILTALDKSEYRDILKRKREFVLDMLKLNVMIYKELGGE